MSKKNEPIICSYIEDDSTAVHVGRWGSVLRMDENNGGSTNNDLQFQVGSLPLIWKRQGANPASNPNQSHPDLSAQEYKGAYVYFGSAEMGYRVTIDIEITIKDNSKLGKGPDGKGWYFIPELSINPDFNDPLTIQVPGTLSIWINDGHLDRCGTCKWSRNVGSGIDGILLNLDGGHYAISEDYPRTWPNGTKFRFQIEYYVKGE